ncbi:unnamed protein product [Linum trigynum]|uniref:Uncharacterized protein n=1 Tax=Linum trigynum TaxID=586398 RepID=A0AAV2FF11_9ROSI
MGDPADRVRVSREFRSIPSFDRERREMWKQELDEELENFRSILGIMPRKISSNDGVPWLETVHLPTGDQKRRWKEELEEELRVLRLNPHGRNTSSPPTTTTTGSTSSEQRRRWKQELAEEMERQ